MTYDEAQRILRTIERPDDMDFEIRDPAAIEKPWTVAVIRVTNGRRTQHVRVQQNWSEQLVLTNIGYAIDSIRGWPR